MLERDMMNSWLHIQGGLSHHPFTFAKIMYFLPNVLQLDTNNTSGTDTVISSSFNIYYSRNLPFHPKGTPEDNQVYLYTWFTKRNWESTYFKHNPIQRKKDVLFGFLIKQDKWFCACWNPQARAENLKTLQKPQESLKLSQTKNSRYLQRFQERERVPVLSRKTESN